MIIGLGHKAGTGKNTAGEFLFNWLAICHLEISVKLVSFASPLKSVAFQMYGWAGLQSGEYYETNYQEKEVSLPAIGKSPRQVWIELGNYARQIYPETWVRMALAARCDVLIITDARYPNELAAIKAANGLNVKIERDSAPKRSDIADCAADGFDAWDFVIQNNADLATFYDNLEPLKEHLTQRLNLK